MSYQLFDKIISIASIFLFIFTLLLIPVLIITSTILVITDYIHTDNYSKGNITLQQYCDKYKYNSIQTNPAECFKLLNK